MHVTFSGSQESEGTRNGCAQARGNHRVWPEWPQGSVRHAGWQAILLWWWANHSKYDEPVWWVHAELALQTHFFMLVLVCCSWTSWHLLAWHRYISLTKKCSTLYGTTCKRAAPIWWDTSTGWRRCMWLTSCLVTHIGLHKIIKSLFTFEPYVRCSVHSTHPPLHTPCGLLATLLVSKTI